MAASSGASAFCSSPPKASLFQGPGRGLDRETLRIKARTNPRPVVSA